MVPNRSVRTSQQPRWRPRHLSVLGSLHAWQPLSRAANHVRRKTHDQRRGVCIDTRPLGRGRAESAALTVRSHVDSCGLTSPPTPARGLHVPISTHPSADTRASCPRGQTHGGADFGTLAPGGRLPRRAHLGVRARPGTSHPPVGRRSTSLGRSRADRSSAGRRKRPQTGAKKVPESPVANPHRSRYRADTPSNCYVSTSEAALPPLPVTLSSMHSFGWPSTVLPASTSRA